MPLSATDPARALATLQRLLEIPASDLHTALTHAANAIADALAADKVDAFLYDESRDSLAALGTSTQPLSAQQKKLGLDVLQISNGGRVVHVYVKGQVFRTGRLLEDPEELRGVKEGLRIQSKLGIPLYIGSQLRGVLMIAALAPDHFSEADEAFACIATRWVGIVAHRAELIEEIQQNALEDGRRTAAEEVITVLAHDLRNYIAPITGRLYLLRHRAETSNDRESLDHVGAALNGVAGLTGLITNLLDMARIERGIFSLDVEPCDLAVLARESAGALETPEHRIVVMASEPVLVAADPARLRQCLDNLMANAVSHSPRGAAVNVTLSRVDDDGAWGQLEVIDEGPGVPPEVMPHLFERFATGRASEGGVGLGLYLANRIAKAHGGSLCAESPPGKGARFVLRVPRYDR
jgi:two-component system, OmpR family, sensor kinase